MILIKTNNFELMMKSEFFVLEACKYSDNSIKIGTYILKIFKSEISRNVINLCPVGFFQNKNDRFKRIFLEVNSIMMKKSIKLFEISNTSKTKFFSRGALTSKPYAFKARP